MASESPGNQAEFVVVMRASSGFYFPALEDALIVESFPTPIGRADFLFASRFAPTPGFTKPVRRGLRVEARGWAESLDAATDAFASAARGLAAVLSFSANIACGDLAIEIVFDGTPGKTERAFFQQFLPEERWTPHPGRALPTDAAYALIRTVATHRESARLHRAIAHYYHALQRWDRVTRSRQWRTSTWRWRPYARRQPAATGAGTDHPAGGGRAVGHRLGRPGPAQTVRPRGTASPPLRR